MIRSRPMLEIAGNRSGAPVRNLRQPRGILSGTSSHDDEEDRTIGRPKTLPPGLSRRGDTYVYDWRDATGRKYRRKAGDTIAEAIAYKTASTPSSRRGRSSPAAARRSRRTPPSGSRRIP